MQFLSLGVKGLMSFDSRILVGKLYQGLLTICTKDLCIHRVDTRLVIPPLKFTVFSLKKSLM